ncbi:MAG TPA: cytochrome c-type biogenesis protein [Thermoanaerobaculia bacterium]
MRLPQAIVALAFLIVGASNFDSAIGPPRSAPLGGEALEQETNETSALVRCPVCQGLSVADSPAPMAVKMREQIRELHAAGYDREQVMSYFERSYGEFVRLDPPRRGINWLVWLAPLAGLLIGAVVLLLAFRSLRARRTPEPPPQEDPELQPYLERVRALAYETKAPEES